MAKQRLTDRQLISGITLTDLLHFVITGDTSQNPAGSSYKGTVTQLFDAFSSYTCTNPLIVDTVNACDSGITINGNVTINGSATTINTEVIQSKDNNIILNYSGNHTTALWGGITVEDGQSDGVDSLLYIDADGCWHADPGFCDLTVDGIPFTAQTPYLFVDDGSVNSITTRYSGNIITNSDYSNIGGGKGNTIDPGSDYSNIAGGLNNLIDDYTKQSFIGGGYANEILGGEGYFKSNVVVGGEYNVIDISVYSSIVGGKSNTIYSSNLSFIGGGSGNTLNESYYSIIGGGRNNSLYNNTYSTIVGGNENTINTTGPGKGNSILVGFGNTISGYGYGGSNLIVGGGSGYYGNIGNTIDGGTSNVIVGGSNYVGNRITGDSYNSIIVGGDSNVVRGGYNTTIVGGYGNVTYNNASFIGGGVRNKVIGGGYTGSFAVIVGGIENEINGIIATSNSFIGGGLQNIIGNEGRYGVIAGGRQNTMTGGVTIGGGSSVIGGGQLNNIVNSNFSSIGGGDNNTITSGNTSVIVGGGSNNVNSDLSFIGGGRLNVINNTFSSIVGGSGNTINHTNSHIIGTTITSISANTTHVERFNIGTVDTGSTATEVLVRETNGMVNTTPLSAVTGGLSGKYVELITGYTANVTQTITHNLGTGDEVVADVIDTTNNERISSVIDNYQTNALDLTLSQNYASIKIVIIG